MPEYSSDMALPTPTSTAGEVTRLLAAWNAESPVDRARLFDLIYPELMRIAEFRMRRAPSDRTLNATALVNEFVVQLGSVAKQPPQNRLHFTAAASRAIRQILVEHARAHSAEKRSASRSPFKERAVRGCAALAEFNDILEIDDLLQKLARQDLRMAEVVELRYFGGLSNGDAAEILDVSERTVKREWQLARAWLYAHWNRGRGDASPGVGRDQADLRFRAQDRR